MPVKDTYIEFEKHNTKLPCPFVTYGDFECRPVEEESVLRCPFEEDSVLRGPTRGPEQRPERRRGFCATRAP